MNAEELRKIALSSRDANLNAVARALAAHLEDEHGGGGKPAILAMTEEWRAMENERNVARKRVKTLQGHIDWIHGDSAKLEEFKREYDRLRTEHAEAVAAKEKAEAKHEDLRGLMNESAAGVNAVLARAAELEGQLAVTVAGNDALTKHCLEAERLLACVKLGICGGPEPDGPDGELPLTVVHLTAREAEDIRAFLAPSSGAADPPNLTLLLSGVDEPIRDIVRALNVGGLKTIASCCGHNRLAPRIDLVDGRVLRVETYEQAKARDDAVCVDINGDERPAEREAQEGEPDVGLAVLFMGHAESALLGIIKGYGAESGSFQQSVGGVLIRLRKALRVLTPPKPQEDRE